MKMACSNKITVEVPLFLNYVYFLFTCMALSCVLMTLYCLFEDLSPWIFLVTAIPTMLTGNNTTFFAIILSYISDTSTKETRGMRMAFSEVALATGSLLGSISSSYIFYATNYPSMFAIGLGCVLMSIAYTIFFVPESIENISNSKEIKIDNEAKKEKLIQLKLFKEIIQTTIKKRENYDRSIIVLTIISIIIYISITHADTSTRYIFLRGKLNWTFTKYNIYNSICSLIWVAGTMTGTYILQRKFHVPDSILAFIGLISMLSCFVLQFIATNDTIMYIAGGSRCLIGLVAPMLRANISRLVPSDEVGKIFAMVVGGGALAAASLTPVYTVVYNSTIYINSALYNLISISLLTVTIALVMLIIFLEQISKAEVQTVKEVDVKES
ncbi:probable peptidoglycan muropeptide transporter SLC46 isoform X2 [Diabrotica undecimpunctata]|uniref:probable peptidoglycan muropeptide transporter SLC46 isoform X2 n=1 Tax=Diabrotica undecimpunctata TaxID=50387 RepID=UPI003B641609